MKKLMSVLFFAVFLFGTSAHADDVLTGDVKLACEALLCLASGKRPDECQPSLQRYFSINAKKWNDTVRARKNFLQLCPASNEDEKMRSLTDTLVQGAGRCDAQYLNQTLARREERLVCPTSNYGMQNTENCYTETFIVIGNQKPSYCVAYGGHEYTRDLSATYVGDPMNGGRWR